MFERSVQKLDEAQTHLEAMKRAPSAPAARTSLNACVNAAPVGVGGSEG